jgi:hypothetical protein
MVGMDDYDRTDVLAWPETTHLFIHRVELQA